MSYIDDVAQDIRRRVLPDLLPEGDTDALFRTYAVLAMAKGDRVELEDVHDAWAAWMSEQNPDHPSLKPLRQLSPNVQRADQPYLDAIREAARDRRLGRSPSGQ